MVPDEERYAFPPPAMTPAPGTAATPAMTPAPARGARAGVGRQRRARPGRRATRQERRALVDAQALTQAWAQLRLAAAEIDALLRAAATRPGDARPAPAGTVEPLTAREREVLVRLGQRWSNKEIAAALQVSPETVKRHAATIYAKLGAGGRRAAAQRAAELGLLPAL